MFFCPFPLWTITVWEKFFSKSVCVPKKIKCKVWNDMEFQLLLTSILWTTEVSGKLNLLLCSAEQHEGEIFGWTVPLTQSNMHMHTEAIELFMFFSWCVWAGVKTGMRQERGNLTSKCPHPDLLLSDSGHLAHGQKRSGRMMRESFSETKEILLLLYCMHKMAIHS